VPEPATLELLAIGALGLLGVGWVKRRAYVGTNESYPAVRL
jgi:hypothetical protein